ncbi:MAG: hypothetical protein ABIQ18_07405 [Umezawaea sp.]
MLLVRGCEGEREFDAAQRAHHGPGQAGRHLYRPDDSGGPIYTISGGKVVAKGVHSGGGKYTDGDCLDVFTDIRLAEKALPGIVKKG